MYLHKEIIQHRKGLNTTENFIGESIEDKVRRVLSSGEPVEAISPMIYTERKDGVRRDTDIRTDKWDVAQEAMESISLGKRTKREERMKEAVQKEVKSTDVGAGSAGNSGQTDVN